MLEIRRYAHTIEYYAGLGKNIRGGYIPQIDENKYGLIIKRPLGVVGAIVPWNFPVSLMGNKIGPALLAGNTMVIKPAQPRARHRCDPALPCRRLHSKGEDMHETEWRG